jgi:hypothetical protein
VAREFLNVLEDRQLVSDAPEFEARWLSRLLAASGENQIPLIEDFDNISFAMFSDYALDMLYETVERRPAPHRAGPDSARMARGWRGDGFAQISFKCRTPRKTRSHSPPEGRSNQAWSIAATPEDLCHFPQKHGVGPVFAGLLANKIAISPECLQTAIISLSR